MFNTKSPIAVLSAVLFFLWLLPLGIFIKSSNEKIACGGQRAICMCSHMAKASGKPVEAGYAYKGGGTHEHETAPAGSVSPSFVIAKDFILDLMKLASDRTRDYAAYKSPHLSSLEHVPKA